MNQDKPDNPSADTLLDQAIKALERLDAPPGPSPKQNDQLLAAIQRAQQSSNQSHLFRRIVMNRFNRIAVAIAAAAALTALIWLGAIGSTSIALAQVVEQVRQARTATYLIAPPFESVKIHVMALDSGKVRFRMNPGDAMQSQPDQVQQPQQDVYVVLDIEQNKMMSVDPNRKLAVMLTADGEHAKQFRQLATFLSDFRDLKTGQEEKLGERETDGVTTIGFRLKRAIPFSDEPTGYWDMWVNPKTALPERIEIYGESQKDKPQERKVVLVMRDFQFDQPLDEDLFNLQVPEGYQSGETTMSQSQKATLHMNSMHNMQTIRKACEAYAKQHDEQWPDNLNQLERFGVKGDVLNNPLQPDRKVGYVYIKPRLNAPKDADYRVQWPMIVHEAFDAWPSEGIRVQYRGGGWEHIADHDQFRGLIEKTKSE